MNIDFQTNLNVLNMTAMPTSFWTYRTTRSMESMQCFALLAAEIPWTMCFCCCCCCWFFFSFFLLSHHQNKGVISWILTLVIPSIHIKEDVYYCGGIIDLCWLWSTNSKIVCGMIYVPCYVRKISQLLCSCVWQPFHKGGKKLKLFTLPSATFDASSARQ